MTSRIGVVAGVLVSLLSAPVATGGQPQTFEPPRPHYDAAAPPLAIELLQAPAGTRATWESLKGNAVVLEFWATWCSGCVAAIPHLNELTGKYKDKPVRFISVTDEDRDVVTAFLVQRPIAGWVGLDARSGTFRNFGIEGRPLTALIDAEGTLRGILPPDDVNESVVDRLLAGTFHMKEPPLAQTRAIGTEPNAPLPVLGVIVRPAMPAGEVGMSPGGERSVGTKWEVWGANLRRMLAYAYGFSEVRMVLPASLETARYDLSITLPDSGVAGRNAMLRQVVASTFGVDVRREMRQTDVYVLRKAQGVSPSLAVSDKGRTLGTIVRTAERLFARPVIDETGLTERYVFVLAYTGDPQVLAAAIRKDLGLELVPERRPIEFLVVEHTRPASRP